MRDPYEVLGVGKNASAKEIKAAYRKLAKQHHPDQNPDDSKAKDRFAAANQAYEILGDEKSRTAFDRGEIDAEGKPRFQGFEGAGGDPFAGFRRQQAGPGGGPGGTRFEFRSGGDPFGGGASDIFSEIFGQTFSQQGAGGGARRAPPGRDVNVTLDVTVEEAATAPKVTAMFPDGRKIRVETMVSRSSTGVAPVISKVSPVYQLNRSAMVCITRAFNSRVYSSCCAGVACRQ